MHSQRGRAILYLSMFMLCVGTAVAQVQGLPVQLPSPTVDIPTLKLPQAGKVNLQQDEKKKPVDKEKEKEKEKPKEKENDDAKNDDGKQKDDEPKKESWKPWQPTGTPLTLGQCLAIGQERQPAIHAATASLAASERGYLALFHLNRVAEFFSPDLPLRRQQSQKGIAAAVAEVYKARQENTYDVTRLYFNFVFATQQEQTASDIVEQLEAFYASAVEILKIDIPNGKLKLNKFTLSKLDDAIGVVRSLRDEASFGRQNAYYALKESMGVGREFDFSVAMKELPLMSGDITMEQVIDLALARRPEVVQAQVVVDVTGIEVRAQAMLTRRQQSPTFANGADLHSRILPAPQRNVDYRPGAVPPEMPSQLIGTVEDRVAKAEFYVRHQEAAYEKAIGLIRLEASYAFLEYQKWTKRVLEAKARHDRSQSIVEDARVAAAANQDPELIVTQETLASKAQAEYVEAVHKQVQALVSLEKVTGGGISPRFPGR